MRHKTIEKLGVNTRLKGIFLLFFTCFTTIALMSYNPFDESWNVISTDETKNWFGKLGALYSDLLLQFFGYSIFICLPFYLFLSYRLIVKNVPKYLKFKIVYSALTMLSISFLMCFFFTKYNIKSSFSPAGGLLGYKIYQQVSHFAIKFISIIVSTTIILLYPYACFKFGRKTPKQLRKEGKTKTIAMFFFKCMAITSKIVGKILKIIFLPLKILGIKGKDQITKTAFHKKEKKEKRKNNNDREKQLKDKELYENDDDVYFAPSISLLKKIEQNSTLQSNFVCKENMGKLERILGEFGVRGEMVSFQTGPIVTLYEFKPQAGIKSSRVIGLCDDIARTMMVSSVRISIMTGKDTLGIEVPNKERSIVCFRDLVESNEYQISSANIPLILGCNIFGKPTIADLTEMPHLLIAGTTGSGKSVGINGMILSMLYKLSPEQCKLIMIDPKMLEFSSYQGIPHLMMPVITEAKDAILSLKWVVREMERRYRLMSETGVRNISGYNAKADIENNKGKLATMEKMPYIVVIIDEMADLMVVAGKEIEVLVQRLSQMARAAGIHLIMATQRPSVDVITGVIKANFPTRISYAVTSKIDSRTILGEQGAEQLLGKGDLLFMMGGGKTQRVHGPLITDVEVENIVEFLKKHNKEPDYVSIVKDEEFDEQSNFNDDDINDNYGDMYKQAIKIVLEEKKTSISYLQRKLRIGYNKAANFIEKMEEEGILSSPDRSGKRMILTKEN